VVDEEQFSESMREMLMGIDQDELNAYFRLERGGFKK
jgi:hypothetical protein